MIFLEIFTKKCPKNLMPKMDSLTHFLSKNDVLCINVSKVTVLNVFQILIVSCPLKRVTKDCLPGGKFHEMKDDQEQRKLTVSTPLHNKLLSACLDILIF